MSIPALPEVHRLVDDLVSDLTEMPRENGALWQIKGAATGGKSAALKLLADRLAIEGLKPIRIAPPTRVLDAGPLAVTEAVVGLKLGDRDDGQVGFIREGARWADKVRKLLRAMENEGDRLVVLCDDPGNWPSPPTEDAHFREKAAEIAYSMVEKVACHRVVAGALPPISRADHVRHLQVKSEPVGWLRSQAAWGPLAAEADELAAELDAELDSRSPLEIRLLVALAALGSPKNVANWYRSQKPTRRDISRRLATDLQHSSEASARFLKGAWVRLALARRSLSEDLLRQIVGEPPDARTAAILRACILYPEGENFTLHWTLRLDAQEHGDWLAEQDRISARALLARYYTKSFKRRDERQDPRALVDEMEAFHHASLSGDSGLRSELQPFFAEQLDLLGRTLSRDFKRYEDAAWVFKRACDWEPEDDYAHHYVAFNFDILADRIGEVEKHYQCAIELRADHPWWHSRWVSYLITRGRMPAARRAWSYALDALGLPEPDAEQSVYQDLHLWVARLLVHRGQLDFADEVLKSIPGEALRTHPGLSAVYRRLKALAEARHARAVFPLWIPHEKWWSGPHLCSRRREDGALCRWMPGRIDAIEDGEVTLQVARPPDEAEALPHYGSISLSADDFDRLSRDERVADLGAGRFVELAWYGTDDEPIIRVHRSKGWEDRDLPPLFPDPARYLRKAGWVENIE